MAEGRGSLVYTWPGAQEKAREADRIVRRRMERLGLEFDEIYTEFLGVDACHGAAAPPADRIRPRTDRARASGVVQLRIFAPSPRRDLVPPAPA